MPNQILNPVPVTAHTRSVDVGGGKKESQVVIDLTKGERTDFMTSRDFFTQQEFSKVRGGIEKLLAFHGQQGRDALANLLAGRPIDVAQKKLLDASLGGFSNQPNAVQSVESWLKSGRPLPTPFLRVGNGFPVLPDDIRQTAKSLATIEGKTPGSVETLYKIANGEGTTVPEGTLQALRDAGIINAKNKISNPAVQVLLQKEGALYRQEAGLRVASVNAAAASFAPGKAPPPEGAHPAGYLDSERNVAGSQSAARYRSEAPRGMEEFPMQAWSNPHASPAAVSVPKAAALPPSVPVEIRGPASSLPPPSIPAGPPAAVSVSVTPPAVHNGAASVNALEVEGGVMAVGREATGASKALKLGGAAAPAVIGAVIEGGTAAAQGKTKYEVLKATGHGAVNGAFGVDDAKIAMDKTQRPADRWLGGFRAGTAFTATVAGGTTVLAPNPVTAVVAGVSGAANVGLGVVQDIAHWTGLANNPGTIEQTFALLQAFDALGEKNQREMLAERQDPLGTYRKALESGDKLHAQAALAVYQKHIMDQYRTGKLTSGKDEDRYSNDDNRNGKNAFKVADRLAQTLYDDAAKHGFQPTQQSAAVQIQKTDSTIAAASQKAAAIASVKKQSFATP
jgi:hypothetical protein